MSVPPALLSSLRRNSTSADVAPPLLQDRLNASYLLPIPEGFFDDYTPPKNRIERLRAILKEVETHAAAVREQKSLLVERERDRYDLTRKDRESAWRADKARELQQQQEEEAQVSRRRFAQNPVAPIDPASIPLPEPGISVSPPDVELMMKHLAAVHDPSKGPKDYNIPKNQTDIEPVKSLDLPHLTILQKWESAVMELEWLTMRDSECFEDEIMAIRSFYNKALETELERDKEA